MIALDLDNTIICYDEAFHSAAVSLGCLEPDAPHRGKAAVKAAALARGGNDLWTRLQGIAYGEGIAAATPYAGCREFLQRTAAQGRNLAILSHKTEFPAIGPRINLRTAALDWLDRHGLTTITNLPVVFCDTRGEKVARLASMAARALLDDLPEVFRTPGFPATTRFVLFDPAAVHAGWDGSERVSSWDEASALLLGKT
jgi:hypothetical protein